ncbi:MAG TPA: hypothetical protein VNZ84_05655 [Methylophilus sp.]|nr:hypothetical protein [Methylophilus sp.]
MKQLRLPTLMTLLWLGRRCAWYIGWIPMLMSVLLLLAWVMVLQEQATQEKAFDALEKEIRQLAIKPVIPQASVPTVIEEQVVTIPEPVQLAELWQQLPAFDDLSPRMMQIANIAQKRNISLNVGDYQWQAHQVNAASHDIQQFDMRFTIQADYVTCRKFIIEVLRKYPSMALTGLELRKNETVQPTIDATLTFSVFIRGGVHVS